MTGKHRIVGERTKRIAVVGAATATVTALTVGAAAPQPERSRPDLRLVHDQPVDLSASTSLFPPPGVLPDITGGLGNSVYNTTQNITGGISEALLNAFSLPHLFGQPSLDLNRLIDLIPPNLLSDVLGAVKIDLGTILHNALTLPVTLPVIGPIDLLDPIADALVNLLHGLNITDAAGITNLNKVLSLVGIDLDSLLDLSKVNVPDYIRIITPGPTFALLKAIGIDFGWTPGTPNAVADRINSTPYLDISASGLLDAVFGAAEGVPVVGNLVKVLDNAIDFAKDLAESVGIQIPDPKFINLRVPVVAGLGLGAFAAGTAYNKVLADLPNQPGGENASTHPLAGSFTVLPMVLLNNMGRANGGMLSRFYPLADLLGIDVLTPETAATHSGGTPLLNTGLAIGGANLIPVKIDATVEYQPFSDFAAWPNPFTLMNNLMAGTVGATYIVRGLDLNGLLDQVKSEVGQIVGNVSAGNPLAVNLYLTLPTKTLPLLEPLYLTGDVLNAVSFGTLGQIPIRLANALAPALTSLVNLGYTDVVRNEDGTYTRTLADPDTPTPFMSFPHVNPGQVVNDIIRSLINGFHKEFFSGHPTATPDLIGNLVKLLKDLSSGKLTSDLTTATTDAVTSGLDAANALPAANARTVTVATTADEQSAAKTGEQAAEVSSGKHAAPEDAPVPEDSGAEPKHALPEESETTETVADTGKDSEAEKDADSTKDSTEKDADSKKDADSEKGDVKTDSDSKKGDTKKGDVTKDSDAAETPGTQSNPKPTTKKNDPLTNVVRDINRTLHPKKKPAETGAADSGTTAEKTEKAGGGSAGEAA